MLKKTLAYLLFSTLLQTTFAQQSLLVNLGSSDCSSPNNSVFSIIKDPLGTSSVLNNCNLEQQLPDFFNTFIAYNPKDNKIYVNDVRYPNLSLIWIMDVGLPNSINCPAVIPSSPNFFPSYSTNNFEFDNSGNLWSLRSYNSITGQCLMDKYDVLTGNILSSKTLQFPSGNFPSDISNGDLCILPNGRLFCTFGTGPSRLYEIFDYNGGIGNASATFLQAMPKNTFGIAYLNGQLEITGTNTVNECYYYDYNISTNTLGAEKNFQNGQTPIDNTSFSPVVGLTKEIVQAQKINQNTAQITYEIYVQNLGNVILNNINVTDDLGAVFGNGNVSNVSANFVPGFNTPGLTLNNSFNGTSNTQILNSGQQLANQTSEIENYHFKLQVTATVTNLSTNVIYYNSAIASAAINSNENVISIIDTSNNGPSTVVDPNKNGIANELGENIPTPFNFNNIVPVQFISNSANLKNSQAFIEWRVATPIVNGLKFIVEFSTDGITWNTAGEVNISHPLQGKYALQHSLQSNTQYRIKQVDVDGKFIYSTIMLVKKEKINQFTVYPNPAKDYINLTLQESGIHTIELIDLSGRLLYKNRTQNQNSSISTKQIASGMYLLKIRNDNWSVTEKIFIRH